MASKKITSGRFQIVIQDVERVATNALIFLAPVLIIYFSAVSGAVGDGVSLSDFNPDPKTVVAITLWFLNTILDFLRKLMGISTYKG